MGQRDKPFKFRTVPRSTIVLTRWQFEHEMHILWMYFPLPSASHSSLYFSSLHLRTQNSRHLHQMCTHLPKALFNPRTPDRILFLTQFPLVPYIWEMCCFKSLDFWFIRMLRNRPQESNTIIFSQQSSGVFVTLQKFLAVSDIQLPPFPELSLSPYILPHILRYISWASEEFKKEKSENVWQLQWIFNFKIAALYGTCIIQVYTVF